MNDKFKKVGIIGACLVAMIGSGGCITTLAVMTVSDKTQDTARNAQKKREKVEFIRKYESLKTKASQNTATGAELLTLAHISHDKTAMQTIEQPSDKATLDKNYLNYLNQAIQKGDANAKKEWLRLQFMLNSKLVESDTLLPQLSYQQTMNEYLQQANSNVAQFCESKRLMLNSGVKYPTTESRDYLMFDRFITDHLPKLSNNNLTEYSILLAGDNLCGGRSDTTSIPNFRKRVNEDLVKNDVATSTMNTAVFYGAILELSNDMALSKAFYQDLPVSLKTDIQTKAHRIVNEYHKNIHVKP